MFRPVIKSASIIFSIFQACLNHHLITVGSTLHSFISLERYEDYHKLSYASNRKSSHINTDG